MTILTHSYHSTNIYLHRYGPGPVLSGSSPIAPGLQTGLPQDHIRQNSVRRQNWFATRSMKERSLQKLREGSGLWEIEETERRTAQEREIYAKERRRTLQNNTESTGSMQKLKEKTRKESWEKLRKEFLQAESMLHKPPDCWELRWISSKRINQPEASQQHWDTWSPGSISTNDDKMNMQYDDEWRHMM